MEAANAAGQLGPVPCGGTFWFSGDFAHPGRENRRITAFAFNSPSFGARSKDLSKVRPRQQREAKARHACQRVRLLEAVVNPSR
jgi:hypothetical protein